MHSSRFERLAPLIPIPILVVSCLLSTSFAAAAQSDSIAADGVGVARISLIDGSVDIQRGDATGALAAVVNAPVLGGDYLTTGDASRSEVQFDGSTQLRLSSDAQVRFTHLDSGNRTLQLAQGTIELHASRADGTTEIDTPSIAIKPQTRGAYRITVDADGRTQLTVRSGNAEIDTPQGSQTAGAGTTLIAQGAASAPSIQTVAAIEPDAFDAFNSQRDRRYERSFAASQYVNADIDGVDDLSANGRWVNDGSYGQVWTPSAVGADWAPYRDGRWVWEEGYGWTWVAAEQWGWAPYHYGSWYHSPSYGWCWYPPQQHVYTPWRPALVAFFGFGGGSDVALSFGGGPGYGNIGWVPLAPFEAYHPWWHSGYGNVTNITNITNVTNVTNVNVYKNVQYNAVSSVTSQRFLQGRFERNTPVHATELSAARVFRGAIPVVPTSSNLRFAESAAARTVRTPFVQRSFAGDNAVVRRTAFSEQRTSLATLTHAPLTPLHFKDAQTTPVIPAHAFEPRPTEHATPAAASLERKAVAVPSYATPQHAGAPSDPWTRFERSRALAPVHAATQATPLKKTPAEPTVETITGTTRRSGAATGGNVTITTGGPAYAQPRRAVPTDRSRIDPQYKVQRPAYTAQPPMRRSRTTSPPDGEPGPRTFQPRSHPNVDAAPHATETSPRNVRPPQHTGQPEATHPSDVRVEHPPRERRSR